MIVSEAIKLLKGSELKQLFLKTDKEALIGFINLGILEIHKRFNLWESEAVITVVDGVTLYKLDGSDVNVVINLSDHDLLMIEIAYDSESKPMVLNNKRDIESLHTPRFNQITIPEIEAGETIDISYRASPKFILHEKEELPIPPQFIEALFHYVGSRAHGSVKTDTKGTNNTHYVRFEASCALITEEGLFIQDDLSSIKFEDRGFV